jgi:anti-sigma regulatory factor (Ser/Thr protein kinase)
LIVDDPFAAARGVRHHALFYRSEQHYIDSIAPYIVDGLANDEPVLVAVPKYNLAMLHDALGTDAAEVTLVDITEVGRNPGRMIALFGNFVAKYPGRRVRLVGECVWAGRSQLEYPACVRLEALCNLAFDGHEVTGLCPYNAAQLDARTLADARTTHPLLLQDGESVDSDDYAPREALARCNRPLPTNPAARTYTVENLADLNLARSFAAGYATWLGLSTRRLSDLLLITTELATNSLQHTSSACRLALWQHGRHLVCEASDTGRFDDPLGGHRPPTADGGRGLLLVNAVADLVRTHTTAIGTTIQAYLALAA